MTSTQTATRRWMLDPTAVPAVPEIEIGERAWNALWDEATSTVTADGITDPHGWWLNPRLLDRRDRDNRHSQSYALEVEAHISYLGVTR